MIPLIRRIVISVRARDRLILRKRRELAILAPDGDCDRARLKRQLTSIGDDLARHADELEDLGCMLRDRSLGIVECFGEHEGEIVYFTWRPRTDSFSHWHSLDTGPTCARPLPELEHSGAIDSAD